MAKYKYKGISIPKWGNDTEENEDSILVPVEVDNKFIRCAISDGATESSFSKEWSTLLVNSFIKRSFDKSKLRTTIKNLSGIWQKKVYSKNLPWYAHQKLETGAFATFIGLTINLKEKICRCVAIGDSTMFLIRENKLVFSFPITSSEEFGNTPMLFATNDRYQTDFACSVGYANVKANAGDIIVLASDAIAEWLFKKLENDRLSCFTIKNIMENNLEDFETWLANERQSGNIKNDDTTILFIKFE